MHKTLKLAAIPTGIGLSLLPFRVHAGSEDKQGGISLKVEELSLYTKPEDDYKYVVETTELEESISTVRKSVEPYTTWVQDFLTVLKPKIEHSVHLGKESYEFLKNPPPGFYPRFGVIGFTGIIGLFLARGSRIKKLIYPSGLMALSTSLYYPQQAVTVAKTTGESLYEWSLQSYVTLESLWKEYTSEDSNKKKNKKNEGSHCEEDSQKNPVSETKS
ncbi:apolipoprotein O, a [Erpetoichthys calabaricus]|uniref:MICOS complex subunit n=1 Tax=Erpetoichthys calabaricus TaxID=27687 RepID=A0A8C4S3E6_ERPCA|nr:apolipoprotein O, a [Erpetoichthys calabaricus]